MLCQPRKLYGKGFGDGYEIVDVTKRGSNIFIKYMEGSTLYGKTERELNIKFLDQNDSQYYEYKIADDKVSKAEQRNEEIKRQIDILEGSINSSINESNAPLNSQPNILSSTLVLLFNSSFYQALIEISSSQKQLKA